MLYLYNLLGPFTLIIFKNVIYNLDKLSDIEIINVLILYIYNIINIWCIKIYDIYQFRYYQI